MIQRPNLKIKLQKAMEQLDAQKISPREFREMFPLHFETDAHPSAGGNRCRCGGSRCLFAEFFGLRDRAMVGGREVV